MKYILAVLRAVFAHGAAVQGVVDVVGRTCTPRVAFLYDKQFCYMKTPYRGGPCQAATSKAQTQPLNKVTRIRGLSIVFLFSRTHYCVNVLLLASASDHGP